MKQVLFHGRRSQAARSERPRRGARRRPERASAVRAQIFVEAWPEQAFQTFILEAGLGFATTGWSWIQPERGRYVRFNRDARGRFVEAYDAVADRAVEIGRVIAWEPGARVALGWRQIDWPEGVSTEVDVRFEPIFDGTLLFVEHSGFERLGRRRERTAREYRAAWAGALGWVARRARVALPASRPTATENQTLTAGTPSCSCRGR
jgi:hypothetical protein